MRLYLVRHAQTDWSKADRYCGSSDPPLSGDGEAQARLLARRLAGEPAPFNRLFTSPRIRAVRTAEIVGEHLGLAPEPLPWLAETDFGAWEGLEREEVVRRFPEASAAWEDHPDTAAPPGGESGRQTWARARRALRKIWQPDMAVVVVAHRTFNRIVLSRLLGLPLRHFRRLGQDEACLNILEMDAPLRAVLLVRLNDTSHLAGPG